MGDALESHEGNVGMKPVNLDAQLENADWTKTAWDLPRTEKEFREHLEATGQTVEHFKTLPVYGLNKDKFDWLRKL